MREKRIVRGPGGRADLELGELRQYFHIIPRRHARAELKQRGVFINIPYDDDHLRILDAIAFTVLECGYVPRLAIQDINHVNTRLESIIRAMMLCRFSIHDLTPKHGEGREPRLNMAFELGLAVGASRARATKPRKQVIVFDRERYGTQRTLSDIAGLDTYAHENRPELVVAHVRNFFRTVDLDSWIAGAGTIFGKLERFWGDYDAIERAGGHRLSVSDKLFVMAAWLMHEDSRCRDDGSGTSGISRPGKRARRK